MTKRPKRERKNDPLLHPVLPRRTVACDYAIAPFDEAATQMDLKWGRDRLPTLVLPETAARYGSAMAKFLDAIRDSDPELVAARAMVCVKGLRVMDEEATKLGAKPPSDEIFILQIEDRKIGILRDETAYDAVKAAYPDFEIMDEKYVVQAILRHEQSFREKIDDTIGNKNAPF